MNSSCTTAEAETAHAQQAAVAALPARAELRARFKKLGWSDDSQSRAVFDFLMDARAQMPPGSVLVDLGAGQCRYKFFFQHCNYIAVDFAKSETKWDFSKLDIIADIHRLGFIADDSADFCLNTTTLEHLSEPLQFLREVRRILRPGGRLFLYVPFVMNEHQAPYDFYRYTSYGLRHLCDGSGLRVVSLKPSNGPLYTAMVWVSQTLRQAKGRRLPSRLLLKGMEFASRKFFVPLFDRLDKYSTGGGFPQCWLLVAQKEGQTRGKETEFSEKRRAIESIICCPQCLSALARAEESYRCASCGKAYPVRKNQIVFTE
jgi:SAM-dependent methyltransferase